MQGRSKQRLHLFKDQEMDVQFMRSLGMMSEGGAEVGECLLVASATRDGDMESYSRAWAEVAQRVEGQAETALNDHRLETARLAYLRASNYYCSATGALSPRHPHHRQLWEKARSCFEAAGKLLGSPFEPLKVPFGGGVLPCYWLRPAGEVRPRPTLFVVTGGEGTAMEMYFWVGTEGVRRGYNVLLYEGPLNLGAFYAGLTFTPDCEKPIAAVLDQLEKKEGINPDQLALIGFSFGGYIACRTAALEPRIKALIADSPIRDIYALMTSAFPGLPTGGIAGKLIDLAFQKLVSPSERIPFELAQVVMGVEHPHELIEQIKPLKLGALEQQIICPTLCLAGEEEGEAFVSQAKVFYEHIPAQTKLLKVFTSEEGAAAHCQINNFTAMRQTVYDWLDGLWGSPTPGPSATSG